MKQVFFTAKNIKEHKSKNIDGPDLSQAKFELGLNNGAKCDFDGNTLSCTYSTKSHNPFHQPVKNLNEDYRFTDEIRLEGIELKRASQIKCPANNPEKCSLNKLEFTFSDNGKVDYNAQYPTYSDTTGKVSATVDKDKSSVDIKGFSSKTSDNSGVHFTNVEKGGTQAMIKFEEDSFHIQNKGFGNLGSKFSIESIGQSIKEITEEDATLGYEGAYQIMFQTEPDSTQHSLEINIL